jgi:hypothetical protein
MGLHFRPSYPRETLVRTRMTRLRRVLLLGIVGLCAGGVLFAAYSTHSSAESVDGDCSAGQEKLSRTLDQVRFATSAETAIATAVAYSERSRRAYDAEVGAMRHEPAIAGSLDAQHALAQASIILRNQRGVIERARAISAQSKDELGSGEALVSQAAVMMRDGDCHALDLTMERSGWPKDHLIAELAAAAKLNADINAQLNSVLALITHVQSVTR